MLFLLPILSICFFGCGSNLRNIESVTVLPNIYDLKNETYYFASKKLSNSVVKFQPLERFDLIFAGHDIDLDLNDYDKIQNLSALTPGRYTHVLAYIGKDNQGHAYAVEMNVDKKQDFKLSLSGLKVSGRFYLSCLGADFNHDTCPSNSYTYGLNSYDYMEAKRLKPVLRKQLMAYENQLIESMAVDLSKHYPFQIPLDINFKTISNKAAYLVDDGRKNGADCASYFVSLFEEVANICLEDTHINASTLSTYYQNNPIGKKALIPQEYNPVLKRTESLNNILGELGYTLFDNLPRQRSCSNSKTVKGIPMPNLIFNSPSLVSIKTQH